MEKAKVKPFKSSNRNEIEQELLNYGNIDYLQLQTQFKYHDNKSIITLKNRCELTPTLKLCQF